jgi:Spy/CpxP family protein refolding chaperone
MKLKIIACILLMLTAGGISAAWADSGCDCQPPGRERHVHGPMGPGPMTPWPMGPGPMGPGPMGPGPGGEDGEHQGWGFDRIGKALGLNETQRAKVAEIFRAEREKSTPLQQKLADNQRQLRQVAQATKFDEAAVRQIAVRQAQLLSELMVTRARAQNQIHSLLTPEQQARAAKFPPPGGMRGPGEFPPPVPDCGHGGFPPPVPDCGHGGFPPPPGGRSRFDMPPDDER